VLLLQPSSAAAEIVFSVSNASFGASQVNMLEDLLGGYNYARIQQTMIIVLKFACSSFLAVIFVSILVLLWSIA